MSGEEITFGLVKPDDLGAVWPMVDDYLERALSTSLQHEWTAAQLFWRCHSGEFVLGIVRSGARVVGAVVFDSGTDPRGRRFVAIVCCGGVGMDAWLGGVVALGKKLAELASAERVVVVGRRGWERTLRAHGFDTQAVVLSARTEAIETPVSFESMIAKCMGS